MDRVGFERIGLVWLESGGCIYHMYINLSARPDGWWEKNMGENKNNYFGDTVIKYLRENTSSSFNSCPERLCEGIGL